MRGLVIVCLLGCSASQPASKPIPKPEPVSLDLACKVDNDCGWNTYWVPPTSDECICPGCPSEVLNHAGVARRKAAHDKLCTLDGGILNNRRVCGAPACMRLPEIGCHRGRCMAMGSVFYDRGVLWH